MKNTVKYIAAFLVLVALVTLCAGCGKNVSEYETVNTDKDRFFYIVVSTEEEDDEAEVTIQHLVKDKKTKEYEAVNEYHPGRTNNGNYFCQTVRGEGIYQIDIECPGYKSESYTVNVGKNTVYKIEAELTKEKEK